MWTEYSIDLAKRWDDFWIAGGVGGDELGGAEERGKQKEQEKKKKEALFAFHIVIIIPKSLGNNQGFLSEVIKFFVLASTYSPLTSTIGTTVLNFRVRNEIGCDHCVKTPTQKIQFLLNSR